jgi:hypothetical protein
MLMRQAKKKIAPVSRGKKFTAEGAVVWDT